LFKVRLLFAVPKIISSLQVAWPSVFLASILSDLASGRNTTVGSLITGTISQGSLDKKATFVLACSIVGYLGYFFFGYLNKTSNRYFASRKSEFYIRSQIAPLGLKSLLLQGCRFLLTFFLFPFLLWSLWSFTYSETLLVKSPIEIFQYFSDADFGKSRLINLVAAGSSTIFYSIIGMFVVLSATYVLILSTLTIKRIGALLDPVLVLFQATPIIAWLGLLKLIDNTTILYVTTAFAAAFFPAYLFVKNRIEGMPIEIKNSVVAFGENRYSLLKLLYIPMMKLSLTEIVSLTAPRIILGVMLTEYFITLEGFGGLIYVSRGGMNIEYFWSVLVIVGIFSIIFLALNQFTKNYSQRFNRL
jgi:ABC-type nitrate/sulfonate/bicarbonate transport system permease component